MSTYTADIVIRETGGQQAAQHIDNIKSSAEHAHPSVQRLERGVEALKEVLIALGLAMTVEKIIHMADEYNVLMKRLAQVTSSGEEQMRVWTQLSAIAQEHAQSIDGVTNMYVAMTRALASYKISSDQIISSVKSMSAILQASGRSADDVNGAMRRLAAGMAQGTLSGRTMTTLFVQFPELMDGMAKASGRSTQAIKIMAENGSISMQTMMGWIEKAASTLKKPEHAALEVSEAMTKLKNSLMESIGVMDRAGDGSSRLASVLEYIGRMAKATALIVNDLIDNFRRFGIMIQQVAGIIQMLITREAVANPALEKHAHNTHAAASASTQAAAAIGQHANQTQRLAQSAATAATANGRVAQSFQQLAASTAPAAQGFTHINQITGEVTVTMGGTGQRVVELGTQLDGLTGKITVTRGALEGFTKTVYDNGKAMQENVINITRTTSTIDALGNTTKVTSESIKDMDGRMIGLKKTIETVKDGITTVRVYTQELDGTMRLLSETVTEATRRLDDNASALGRNAMALGVVKSAAEQAAAAYQHLASAESAATNAESPGGTGSNGPGGSSSRSSGVASGPPGFHYAFGGTGMGGGGVMTAVPDDSTLAAFADFNHKVRDLKMQIQQMTGISQWNWPASSPFNPYDRIPNEQTPNFLRVGGGSPVGSIPSISELVSLMQTYGVLPSAPPAGSPTGPGMSQGGGSGGINFFAGGGGFDVGGQGGTDSQYVHFMATPGEHVNVTRGDKRDSDAASGAPPRVHVNMNVYAQDAGSFGRNRTQIMAQLTEGVARAHAQLQRRH